MSKAYQAQMAANVFALTGRLDVHAAADVRLALADAVDNGDGELILDLAALEAVDATGLGVLVGAHRRAQRAGRTLVLEDVPATVGRLLFVTRLDRVLQTRRSASSPPLRQHSRTPAAPLGATGVLLSG